CFAPDTDPAYVDQFYRNREAVANSLGIPNTENDSRFNVLNRWATTASDGPGLSQGDLTTLTWSYVPDGTPIGNGGCGGPSESQDDSDFIAFFNRTFGSPATPGDFTTAPWHNIFVDMFEAWSSKSGLIFVYEPNDDGATVVTGGPGILGTRGDFRISGHDIDGNSGILACNYFPQNGDMIIDTADNFYGNNPTLGTKNVLTHEIGHGLGVAHVCPISQTKLMEPFVTFAFDGPQEDDILATNRSYGDPEGVNDTAITATFLGAEAIPALYSKSQRSIDDNSDIDYFSFTTSEASTVSVTLTPTGTTYLSGTQNSNGSCSAGTSFNALTISDLMVEILDTDGSTVIATADAGGIGSIEGTVKSLPVAGTYFVRVQQQGAAINNVQMYDLDLNINNDACTSGVPANLASSEVTDSTASISWDAQTNALYDLRYRESSTADWTEIGDLGVASYTITGLTALTEYELQVRSKCEGGTTSQYSASIFFTTLEEPDPVFPEPYCGPLNFALDIEPITLVDVAGISNISDAPVNNSPGHEDFTALEGVMVEGMSYPIVLEGNTVGNFTNRFVVFIDWNQNEVLDDAGEVYEITETIVNSTGIDGKQATGTIVVPSGVTIGTTRMRVKKIFGTTDFLDPCLGTSYGQAEDYTISVTEALSVESTALLNF
ncbi:MAG: GEVED domain-containing protein, partial [Winogradskyella sp.]|nr:GEVED domain-containing protein [Winogradskyella sp.]